MLEFFFAEFEEGIGKLAGDLTQSLTPLGENLADGFKSYAKANAPWTDRTGGLRRSIDSVFIVNKDMLQVILFDDEPYGVFLELCFEKRYAILMPTVELLSADILNNSF